MRQLRSRPLGIKWQVMLFCVALLGGCGQNEQPTHSARELQPIAPGDECHVCGMQITAFPGPKGQAFIHNRPDALKFCSTVDLFTWLLQPETPGVLEAAYVQDMTAGDWEHPDKAHYIEARNAWYVAGHDQRGAMGPTLASFATQAAAEQFTKAHGGHVLAFEQVDLQLLANLGDGGMSGMDERMHQH